MRSPVIAGWVFALVLGMVLPGCGASSLDSNSGELARRESLSADELDALTAAGESRGVVKSKTSAPEEGFQPPDTTLQDVPGALSSGQIQLPSRQPMAMPTVRQSNSIRQVR